MALVTISGFPSSGKTTRAKELAAFLTQRIEEQGGPARKKLKVVHVDDDSLEIKRAAYDDARAEKIARGTFLSAAMRSINKDSVVIADGMNYIKGFRYQLYCAVREAEIRPCTVHIATPPAKCTQWNDQREEKYAPETLDNLISRFEEPSPSVRWDSPLFVVPYDDPPLSEGGATAEAIWAAITKGDVKPPNTATVMQHVSSTSYLSMLELATSALISALMSLQSLQPLSGTVTLSVTRSQGPPVKVAVEVNRPVAMSQLQRLKRQFGAMHRRAGDAQEMSEEKIISIFAEYLSSNMQ